MNAISALTPERVEFLPLRNLSKHTTLPNVERSLDLKLHVIVARCYKDKATKLQEKQAFLGLAGNSLTVG